MNRQHTGPHTQQAGVAYSFMIQVGIPSGPHALLVSRDISILSVSFTEMINRSGTEQSGPIWKVSPGTTGVKSKDTDWKNVLVCWASDVG